MDSFIQSLKLFSNKNFPIKEVSDFISKSQFSMKLLEKYSHFSVDIYTRNMIYKDPNFEILLIWFKVVSGSLEICNYKLESKTPLRLKQIEKIHAPAGYVDGPADIHSINNCYKEPVVTLHVYAKPYDSCEIYDLKKKEIKRLQMDYYSINGQLC